MEFENLAIANTRDGILKVLRESHLPVMVIKLILGEITQMAEREADATLKQEHEMKAEIESKRASEEKEPKAE